MAKSSCNGAGARLRTAPAIRLAMRCEFSPGALGVTRRRRSARRRRRHPPTSPPRPATGIRGDGLWGSRVHSLPKNSAIDCAWPRSSASSARSTHCSSARISTPRRLAPRSADSTTRRGRSSSSTRSTFPTVPPRVKARLQRLRSALAASPNPATRQSRPTPSKPLRAYWPEPAILDGTWQPPPSGAPGSRRRGPPRSAPGRRISYRGYRAVDQ